MIIKIVWQTNRKSAASPCHHFCRENPLGRSKERKRREEGKGGEEEEENQLGSTSSKICALKEGEGSRDLRAPTQVGEEEEKVCVPV